jgi:hypothetical protein
MMRRALNYKLSAFKNQGRQFEGGSTELKKIERRIRLEVSMNPSFLKEETVALLYSNGVRFAGEVSAVVCCWAYEFDDG